MSDRHETLFVLVRDALEVEEVLVYLVAPAENDGKKHSKHDGNFKAFMKGEKRTSEVSKLGISYWFNAAIQVNVARVVVHLLIFFFGFGRCPFPHVLSHLIVQVSPAVVFLVNFPSWGIPVGIRRVVTALADE